MTTLRSAPLPYAWGSAYRLHTWFFYWNWLPPEQQTYDDENLDRVYEAYYAWLTCRDALT